MNTKTLQACVFALALSACDQSTPQADRPEEHSTNSVEDTVVEPAANEASAARKSIIRPSIVDAAPAPPVIRPVSAIVPFPEHGMELSEEARASIDNILSAPVMATNGPIILRGHSDARGSDMENRQVSKQRAEVVRDYLLSRDIPADRITIIPLGEYRPIAPNAKPDGSDDPAGRAKNRRVEIEIQLPPAPQTEAQPPTDAAAPATR